LAKESEAAAGGEKLLTLTEVRKRTGISMPTLQKYKKRHAERIPSVGKGRAQRYPESALAVFAQLREENLSRRGRPRKTAAGSGAAKKRGKAAASKRPAASGRGTQRRGGKAAKGGARKATKGAKAGAGALTLREVANRVGISYPTALRYVKNSLARLPHVGRGRARRFKLDALAVFKQLRSESRPGRKPGSGKAATKAKAVAARRGRPPAAAATGAVTALLRKLEDRLRRVEAQLKRPFRVEVKR
jgi:predicted DNA-binding transcriptional regulator AlpA